MADDRFIIITSTYEPGTRSYRSLGSLAPELTHARLSLVDERDEPRPSRTWAGLVDGSTFECFADAWRLHDEPTDDGHPAARTYTFDGMNWETEGRSPIVYVTLRVLGPHRPAPRFGARLEQ
jgi:hypothetical protein